MRALNLQEIEVIGGGDIPAISGTLGVGSAITGLGAVALAAVAAPELAGAAALYGAVSGVMALGSALMAVAGH